jgi:hypothetical protein
MDGTKRAQWINGDDPNLTYYFTENNSLFHTIKNDHSDFEKKFEDQPPF